jgi:RecB family exonuclease
VSPSRIEAFSTCELRWLLEMVGGGGASSTSQSLGVLVHELAALTGAAELAQAATLTEAELGAKLDEVWDTIDFGGPWFGRKERVRAGEMVRRFLDWHRSSRAAYELVGVETDFDVTLDRARLSGRVDRVERDAAGRTVVVDLKTGKSAPSEADVARHGQLGAYQAAVEAGAFGDAEEPGTGDSGGAVLVQLGSPTRSTKVQKQPALAETDEPGWARELVVSVAERMAGSAFQAMANNRCEACPVRTSCPVRGEGRQVTQ